MVWYKVISELQNFAQMESQALQSFFLKYKKQGKEQVGKDQPSSGGIWE